MPPGKKPDPRERGAVVKRPSKLANLLSESDLEAIRRAPEGRPSIAGGVNSREPEAVG